MKALRILGYTWSLPHTLLGLVLALVYRGHSFRWENGALTYVAGSFLGRDRHGYPAEVTRIWGRPGAQTHGCVIAYASKWERNDPRLARRELEHVRQGMRWGPLYVLSYGAHFLWRWVFGLRMRWWDAYHGVCWERWARRAEEDEHGPF